MCNSVVVYNIVQLWYQTWMQPGDEFKKCKTAPNFNFHTSRMLSMTNSYAKSMTIVYIYCKVLIACLPKNYYFDISDHHLLPCQSDFEVSIALNCRHDTIAINVYQSSLPIFFGSFSSVYPDTWHNLAETHLKRNFGTDTSQLWQSLFHLETVTRVSKSQCHVFTILITFGVIQLCQIYERNRKIYKKTFFWIKLIENSLLKKNNNFSPIESVVVLAKPQNNIVIITGLGKVEIFVPMAMAFAGENEAWLENSYV